MGKASNHSPRVLHTTAQLVAVAHNQQATNRPEGIYRQCGKVSFYTNTLTGIVFTFNVNNLHLYVSIVITPFSSETLCTGPSIIAFRFLKGHLHPSFQQGRNITPFKIVVIDVIKKRTKPFIYFSTILAIQPPPEAMSIVILSPLRTFLIISFL